MATYHPPLFKLCDNKIPCGGFNVYGDLVIKDKNIEDASITNMLNLGDTNYIRFLRMDMETYLRIVQDMNNDVYDTYYDVKFAPYTFHDFIKTVSTINDLRGKKVGESLEMYKKYFPFLCDGTVMDFYDVADLYSKNLGLKTVPTTSGGFKMNNELLKYYRSDTSDFYSFIQKSTGIYGLDNLLDDKIVGVTFYNEFDTKYIEGHKNSVTITGPK